MNRLSLVTIFLTAAGALTAQTCVTNGSVVPVRAEGITEALPDITIACTGGTVGNTASLTMFLSLNAPITNRLDANGNLAGITFTGASGSFRVTSPTNITFDAVNYVIAPAGVQTTIRFSGLRVAASSIVSTGTVYASVVGVGASFNGGQVALATTSLSLASSVISNGVPCNGSPLPDPLTFAAFANATNSSTIRVTEVSAGAFAVKRITDDSGTRVLLRLTGYGAGARIFVPDAIVGGIATQPTTNGAFGSTSNAGTYTPSANQLLLARVTGNDANGAGGSVSFAAPTAVTTFSTMTELTVTSGAASVVYEVLDSNPNAIESTHIPVFVVVAATTCPSALRPDLAAVLAPVSTVIAPSATAAIPRFTGVALRSDCDILRDCTSLYFPKLSVDQTPVVLTGTALGDTKSATVRVGNTGTGLLGFTTSIAYAQGTGWLSVSPPSGANNVALQVIADPSKLTEGTYTATVTVSAGDYGSGTVPVTFNVGPVGVVVQNVGNAASFDYGTVAAGSYAVLYGLNMGGTAVGVTFNGIAAQLVYTSAGQINLIVPPSLAGQQAAAVVVTVNGKISNSFRVTLAPNAIGVFNPGIINYIGGQVNTVTNPANRGDIISVYITGLANPVTGPVTVDIGNQTGVIPAYAGPQGTFPALSQVNLTVPAALPASPNAVSLKVCIPNTVGQRMCSNAVNLYIK